jgi:hypothetical protein
MLFRTREGKLIEIKKYDCLNDKLYYETLMAIKRPNSTKTKILPKLEKTFDNKNN